MMTCTYWIVTGRGHPLIASIGHVDVPHMELCAMEDSFTFLEVWVILEPSMICGDSM
jgi:hypothetical protein